MMRRLRGPIWCALVLLALTGARCSSFPLQAAGTVRTDTVWSQSLGTRKALRIYLPPSYAATVGTARPQRYRVLFYLHGLAGTERDWVELGALDAVMDSLVAAGQPEAIIAMPDGDDGWWTTANMFADARECRERAALNHEPETKYCVPWLHYDDYVARDLVDYLDTHYRTIRSRESRGIAGVSMGGYGAIALGLGYPDVFGAAASHSGVLAPLYTGPRPYAAPPQYAGDTMGLRQAALDSWRTQRLAFGLDTMGWWARDPGRMALRAVRSGKALPALRFDCGKADEYIDQNRAFDATLTALGVSHQYVEWSGAHGWAYWRAHLPESLVFLLAHTQGSPGP